MLHKLGGHKPVSPPRKYTGGAELITELKHHQSSDPNLKLPAVFCVPLHLKALNLGLDLGST